MLWTKLQNNTVGEYFVISIASSQLVMRLMFSTIPVGYMWPQMEMNIIPLPHGNVSPRSVFSLLRNCWLMLSLLFIHFVL